MSAAVDLPAPLRAPAFGTYRPDEVAWLLTDLSGLPLETDVGTREPAIQSGRSHYAESLPVEYRPTAEYLRLFRTSLSTAADRVAHDVGVVAELIRWRRGDQPVLLSFARAGTPIAVLVRRWLEVVHGVAPPHYAVSIVRGRGIDRVAMRYVVAHHDPADVVFVDGWTGKGAITRELITGLAALHAETGIRVPADIAVLADPGGCVALFGSRDDYLIPSACLNATGSGLVSRTVLNPALLGPGDFHGAKFYPELAAADMSGLFLDTVSDRFPAVADAVARDWPAIAAADRRPTWAGWKAVRRLAAGYGLHDVNLVKPGVGETTRVLLRRQPGKVLIRPDAGTELDHIRLLAGERGVPVETVADLPYRCVGLIRPQVSVPVADTPGVGATRRPEREWG